MPDLIAQGTGDGFRWRKGLPELVAGAEVLLGRKASGTPEPVDVPLSTNSAADTDTADPNLPDHANLPQRDRRRTRTIHWQVPWDPSISRCHAILTVLSNDRIQVHRDARARNPIFFRGRPRDRFVVVPGEHFVIGETTFTLARRPGFTDQVGTAPRDRSIQDRAVDSSTPRPGPLPHAQQPDWQSNAEGVTEMAFAASALRDRDFRDTRRRIQLLARLPDIVAGSVDDEELLVRVSDTLLRATPSASAVAIVRAQITDRSGVDEPDADDRNATESASSVSASDMKVLHYDCRENDLQQHAVSSRLVTTALQRRESVLHLWETERSCTNAVACSEWSGRS